jgi:hypothetical protein
MQTKYLKYEITIEDSGDEQVNLQRLFFEVYRLTFTCFSSVVLDIVKNEVSSESRLIWINQLLKTEPNQRYQTYENIRQENILSTEQVCSLQDQGVN